MLVVLGTNTHAQDAVETLSEVTVTADRNDSDDVNETLFDEEKLRRQAPRTLDVLLARDPAFSLFRRQSALFANPTAAGISLGNSGASATSRSLVTLDGIPQNDPFGGWINWTRYHPELLQSVRITDPLESTVWGNLSAAGAVHLRSAEIDPGLTSPSATAGSHGFYGGTARQDFGSEKLRGSLFLFQQEADGFHNLPTTQRGPIDRRLDLLTRGADLRLQGELFPDTTLETRLSWFEERRGNGTALSGNSTEAFDASLRLLATDWDASLYYQKRNFESRFSAAASDRATERLALDQFDVPGQSVGGSFNYRAEGTLFDTLAGLDLRFVRGEANENAGTFRRRTAGGHQLLTGGFLQLEHAPDDADWLMRGSVRLDHWRFSEGQRLEVSPGSGRILRQDEVADRSGWEPSASITFQKNLPGDWQASLGASTGFRAPNINELYRPFRVRTDTTEANPALDPERLTTVRATLHRAAGPLATRFELFHTRIDDAIANVPLTDPAEIAAIISRPPPGSLNRQRRNVDRATVTGGKVGLDWRPSERWQLGATALFTDAVFRDSPGQPLLEGNRFAQTSQWQAQLNASFQITERFLVDLAASYHGSAFDTELATGPLPAFWNLEAGAHLDLTDTWQLTARATNLLDDTIVTGRGGELDAQGQPRAFWVTSRWQF